MDWRVLVDHCQRQQASQGRPDALITLWMEGKPTGATRRFAAARGGPVGQVLSTDKQGYVVGFKADELITFLETMYEKGDKNERG